MGGVGGFLVDWIHLTSFPLPLAQGSGKGFGFTFIDPKTVSTDLLFYILGGIAFFTFCIVYGSYRYQRWKR